MIIRRLAGVLLAVSLITSCSGGSEAPPPVGGNAELGKSNDINPQDPAVLRDGGDLKLALPGYPANFNALQIDSPGELGPLLRWTMPRAFFITPDGEPTVNKDYFTNVELTKTDPQEVTYTINPKAVWSDGTPFTWEDIASQINATKGTDPAYLISAPNGSERVASVTRGVDDRQAVITFASHYADWKGMFAGNGMLYPKTMTANPEVFNRAQLNGPGPSAGPFMVTTADKGAQRIVLTRNPRWWGTPPKLDSVTYTVLADPARIPALQNGALDAVALQSLDDLTIAQRTQGISIRRAPAISWYHFTFNGAPGSILADPKLRVAIIKGIDRQAIADISQRGLVDAPHTLNNHIYVAGQEGYQDNAIPFDAEAAKKDLDALGWQMNGQFREKDGRRLTIRDVFYDAQSTRQIGQIAQSNLAQIGVDLQLNAVAGGSLFADHIIPGNFDVAQFAWAGDAFPFSGLNQIYLSTGESNFGKIGSPEIDAKIEETLSDLDPATARAKANELDKLIWDIGFSLPLFQSPGNVAVRSTLANFGPAGIGDLNYSIVGFTK
ncbi:MAG: ABC transporter family substrate-binding protein [Mycobacterium sp.]